MDNRYFDYKPQIIMLMLMIAGASLGVRALLHYHFEQSALFYVGIPYLIAMLLVLLRSPEEATSRKRVYLNHLIDAFIIMLGSSVILFEGFLCVAMFMPIYLLVLSLVFIADYLVRRLRAKGRGTLHVQLLPLLLLVSSFEGSNTQLSFERQQTVRVSRTVPYSVTEIKQHLLQPMELQKSRSWFLSMFPMPYWIEAGSLNEGDLHKIHYRYYKWFVTNVHEGSMWLQIKKVDSRLIQTKILKDTSYISHYLRLIGTEIKMEPVGIDHTRVTLSIAYERKLDPYWYFQPLTRYGVSNMAELLMKEVIARD